MIPIKVDTKKYKIKAINELTTKEFIELSKIEATSDPIIAYISWQTGLSFGDVFFAKISKSVEKAIGVIPDVTKLSKSNKFNYKLKIETVGQRHQVESCGLEGYELLVFCLAVSQAQSNNIDDVNLLVDKYNDMLFHEVLPAGFFFYMNLGSGKKFELRHLKRLLFLIKIRKSRSKQEYSS